MSDSLPRTMYPRAPELRSLLARLSFASRGLYLLIGGPYIGKSEFLKQLSDANGTTAAARVGLKDLQPLLMRIERLRGKSQEELDKQFCQVLDRIALTLNSSRAVDGRWSLDQRDRLKKELEAFADKPEHPRLVLCLDDGDHLLETMTSEEDIYFASLLDHVSLVVTVSKPPDPEGKAWSRYIANSTHLGLLSDAEARGLFEEISKEFSDIAQVDYEEVQKFSGRHPHLLAMLARLFFEVRQRYDRLPTDDEVEHHVGIQHMMGHLLDLPKEKLELLSRVAKDDTGLDIEAEKLPLTDLVRDGLVEKAVEDGRVRYTASGLFERFIKNPGLIERYPTVPAGGTAAQAHVRRGKGLEYKLLAKFQDHPDKPIPKFELLNAGWGEGLTANSEISAERDRKLSAAVKRLRTQLQDGEIKGVYGVGFRYVPPGAK